MLLQKRYLSFDGQVEPSHTGVIIERLPEDEDGFLTSGGLDGELPVVVAADEAVADLGVGRVGLVPVQGLDSAKYRQPCLNNQMVNFKSY